MSPRTLQRRLSDAGTSYREVQTAVRAELAAEVLETSDATINSIARHMGYANAGDFTRAFKRWSGLTPLEYRKRRSRASRSRMREPAALETTSAEAQT